MPDIKTILARDIETENLDIRYDMSVKRVLGNIPLLAPITKYTVKELKDLSIPMIEQCIDADSIQISQVFVEPGLTNRKIVNDELESIVPGEGRAMNDTCNLISGIHEEIFHDGFRNGKRSGKLNTLKNMLSVGLTTTENSNNQNYTLQNIPLLSETINIILTHFYLSYLGLKQ